MDAVSLIRSVRLFLCAADGDMDTRLELVTAAATDSDAMDSRA
jgi:hypothetical protein